MPSRSNSPWATAPSPSSPRGRGVSVTSLSATALMVQLTQGRSTTRCLQTPEVIPQGMQPSSMLLSVFEPIATWLSRQPGPHQRGYSNQQSWGNGDSDSRWQPLDAQYRTATYSHLTGMSDGSGWTSSCLEDRVLDDHNRVTASNDWPQLWRGFFDVVQEALGHVERDVKEVAVVADLSMVVIPLPGIDALVRTLQRIDHGFIRFILVLRPDQIQACSSRPEVLK